MYGARQTFAAKAVGHRIGLFGNEGFQQLGQRVEPSRRRYGGRHRKSTFGIDDGQSRHHQRMTNTDFDAMFRRSQHGIFRHFRTGSGSGRNRDAWRGPLPKRKTFADHFQIIEWITGIGHQRGGRLGEINHAAAAKADHQIALRRPRTFHRFKNLCNRRLAADCEKLRTDIFFLQCVEQSTGAIRVPSGHNQRTTAKSSGGGRGLRQRSVAENYPSGGCKFKRHALLQPDSFAGKTVVYLILLRGTAIMDSTVSRQRA